MSLLRVFLISQYITLEREKNANKGKIKGFDDRKIIFHNIDANGKSKGGREKKWNLKKTAIQQKI